MAVFTSHAISVGLAVLMLGVFVLALGSLSSQWSDFLNEYEPRHICTILQNSAEAHKPVLGRLHLSLPRKIGGNDYDIVFDRNIIFIRGYDFEYNCTVNSADLTGKAGSSHAYIEFGPDATEIKDG